MKSIGLIIIGVALCIAHTYATSATVKLLTHNLDRLGAVTSIAGGALSITGQGGKHWGLVVQFKGDSQVYLCELHRDPNSPAGRSSSSRSGGIIGDCRRLTKAAVLKGKKGVRVYNFGTTNTTPQELMRKAKSVSINGQDYNVFLRNCQHWAKELLHKLGMSTVWFNVKAFLEKTTGPGWLLAKFSKNAL